MGIEGMYLDIIEAIGVPYSYSGSVSTESVFSAGGLGLILGWERNGYSVQYSSLKNSMDTGP